MLKTDKAPKSDEQYFELVRQFPLRPIRSREQLRHASAMASRLVVMRRRTRPVKDYLAVLSRLIKEYEDRTVPYDGLPEHEMLEMLIREKGVSQEDVAKATGIANSTLSNVLHRKRALTRDHVERLCAYFHVGPGAFIGPRPRSRRTP
jgi:HTH-type transcriptional regulator / antitoxin HigA